MAVYYCSPNCQLKFKEGGRMNLLFALGFWGVLSTLVLTQSAQATVVSPQQQAQLSKLPVPEFVGAEDRFNELIDEVVTAFQRTVAAHGGTLVKEADWDSKFVNATAYIRGDVWKILVWGGLFRVEGMTDDSFQLAICHEAGHIMGGFPFYNGGINATSEGQSDYFAAHVCARLLWEENATENEAIFATAPPSVQQRCRNAWPTSESAHLCARIAVAGEKLMAVLTPNSPVLLTNPDSQVAAITLFSGYPTTQCRVDTYFRGALCNVEWDFLSIPGFGALDRNSTDVELQAHRVSCSQGQIPAGARPECWYMQRVD